MHIYSYMYTTNIDKIFQRLLRVGRRNPNGSNFLIQHFDFKVGVDHFLLQLIALFFVLCLLSVALLQLFG